MEEVIGGREKTRVDEFLDKKFNPKNSTTQLDTERSPHINNKLSRNSKLVLPLENNIYYKDMLRSLSLL